MLGICAIIFVYLDSFLIKKVATRQFFPKIRDFVKKINTHKTMSA